MAYRCHVGDLAWKTTKESLENAFSTYGACEAYIVKNRQTGRSRGYGFVTFSVEKDMIEAIQEMDGQILEGRNITVSKARRPRENAREGTNHQEEGGDGDDYSAEDDEVPCKYKYQCRVGGLSRTTYGQSLGEAFAEFGEVLYAKVMDYYDFNIDDWKSKGYGFVSFASEEDMKEAIKGMDGQELDGRKISVERVGYQCFVGGLAKKTDDETLHKVFNRFGEILDTDVMYGYSKKTGRGYRFGLVTFASDKAMRDAIQGKNGKKIDGREVTVNEVQARENETW